MTTWPWGTGAERDVAVPRSLASFELFKGVPVADREALERRCSWRSWRPNAIVVGRDTTSASVHFVVSGRCRIAMPMPTGRRDIVLDEVGAGGFFGEMSAIDGERRSAVVTTCEPTRTAELDGPSFLDFLAQHPIAALRVMQRLTEVIRQADATILEISGLNAQARIYVEVIRLARGGGQLPANTAVIAPLPRHADIAARAGTVRETVARALNALARKGILERETDRLIIRDVTALRRLADGDRTEQGVT
jgi:CRP/FNR family transcriptional regulator, cyclic AMP receptor protein